MFNSFVLILHYYYSADVVLPANSLSKEETLSEVDEFSDETVFAEESEEVSDTTDELSESEEVTEDSDDCTMALSVAL